MTEWTTRVRELNEAGLTYRQIGVECGMTTGGVGDIASGRTKAPRGNSAIKLHNLHKRVCKRLAKDVA
jgi:hypothetical protein